MAKKSSATTEVQVVEVQHGFVEFCLLGTTPLILNRMSEKVMRELLAPKGKKSAADKASSLKHDPLAEFRASAHVDPNPESPTLLMHLASGFKRAMVGAALDVPGSSKAQLGRLTWVVGERIGIYGVPQMLMSVTRSADMNRTPDVRTRVIVPKWCCRITVQFVRPLLNETTLTNLLTAGGMIQGTGDWRAEKGSGNYGSFVPTSEDNAEYKHLLKHGGRKVQEAAMAQPGFYDAETGDLYRWFTETLRERGKSDLLANAVDGNGSAKKMRGRLANV